jgi:hypothetical protein
MPSEFPMRAAKLCAVLVAAPLAAIAADGPIQDNSFLIEEAYNQEAGVVQHAATFQRARHSRDWEFTFTQEWPIASQKQQFSYTVPLTRLADAPGRRTGIGDVAFNYRYQLVGDGEAPLAISPRFSVIAATGKESEGRGLGATGYETQLPVSLVLTPTLVSHSNVGYTWTPKARDALGNKADVRGWSVGQSLVWLASRRINFMLEAIYARDQEVAGAGRTSTVKSAFVSPGLRWAYDFASGLQIVPGIAFPIGVGPSRPEKSVFLYLSFEHPFRK